MSEGITHGQMGTPISMGSATILIAEDDPVFRRVIAFALQSAGFECQMASDGQEAWNILQETHIDLLVTDHEMPVRSGIELIELLRCNQCSTACRSF